jgi:prolyl-tRNA synthetase
VAPFNAHLLVLNSSDEQVNAEVKQRSAEIFTDLQKKGLQVMYDDRDDKSAGEKFKDADLLGIPWRMVVSQKSLAKNCVEIKKRGEKETVFVDFEEINNFKF